MRLRLQSWQQTASRLEVQDLLPGPNAVVVASGRRHLDRCELSTESGHDRVGDAIEDNLTRDVVDLTLEISGLAVRRADLASAG